MNVKLKTMKQSIITGTLAAICAVLILSCTKHDNVVPVTPVSNPITKDTLSGFLKGTLLAGKTYYLGGDVYVKPTDTLTVQSGVTVLALHGGKSDDPNAADYLSYAIHNSGTLLVEGTKDKQVTFTTNTKNATWPNGYWGGIQSDSAAKYVDVRWANFSYTGGPDIAGGNQYAFSVVGVSAGHNTSNFNSTTKVIVENCSFMSGIDDCLRLSGPIQVSIKGNVIRLEGAGDGDNINIKLGVTGDVAYNYIWSAANNSIKLETSLVLQVPVTKVNVYNNTLVSGGWRKEGETTSGILVDTYANATVYNNLIVNCARGLRITALANPSVLNNYGNNMFYTSGPDSLRNYFYPADDKGKAQTSDVISTGKTNNDPLFTSLDSHFNAFPGNVQEMTDPNNPHLKSGSAAIGKGNTSAPYTPNLGTTMLPGKDIGAFQSDGTGNQRN